MEYRKLGSTGIEVSEIGYGAWGIGGSQWGGADDDESIQALNRAIDLGVNFIDTALAYGDGRSERVVGQVVRERPETIHVATKVPPKNLTWPAAAEDVRSTRSSPRDHIRACAERSLAQPRAGAHRPAPAPRLERRVDRPGRLARGRRRAALLGQDRASSAISINDHQPANALRLIESGAVDTVQVIYNVFDQSPEDELFPACREHGVGVIARVPLDEGGLTGTIGPDTEFPEGDFRATLLRRRPQARGRTSTSRRSAATSASPTDELAEVALRFVLSEPDASRR